MKQSYDKEKDMANTLQAVVKHDISITKIFHNLQGSK
jgi:hypothetical protein